MNFITYMWQSLLTLCPRYKNSPGFYVKKSNN
jgi:hypothetical protein